MIKQCCFKNKKLDIKKYHYWTVALYPNQSYLGRCFIYLNKHREDFFDLNERELKELMKIGGKLKNALKELFNPTKFNYAWLGMEIPHLHFVPRYKKPVIFQGRIFKDKGWGKNYSPSPKLVFPAKELEKIKMVIAKKLNS
jgi:diadenosine tetraphosphate (Ap4A) HIT family hydrolase